MHEYVREWARWSKKVQKENIRSVFASVYSYLFKFSTLESFLVFIIYIRAVHLIICKS